MKDKIKILNYIMGNLDVRAVSMRTSIWRLNEMDIKKKVRDKQIKLYNEEIQECREAMDYIEELIKN